MTRRQRNVDHYLMPEYLGWILFLPFSCSVLLFSSSTSIKNNNNSNKNHVADEKYLGKSGKPSMLRVVLLFYHFTIVISQSLCHDCQFVCSVITICSVGTMQRM